MRPPLPPFTEIRREASINDVAIEERDRLFHWPLGPAPSITPA